MPKKEKKGMYKIIYTTTTIGLDGNTFSGVHYPEGVPWDYANHVVKSLQSFAKKYFGIEPDNLTFEIVPVDVVARAADEEE